jgi:ankyrin repeat protein
MVRMLINLGADVKKVDYAGYSALHWAAVKSHMPLVALMLSEGLDPQLKDKEGKTAHDLALDRKNYGVVKMLRKATLLPKYFPQPVRQTSL